MKELQRQASPNIVIALSGNKADLASKRMVDFEVSLFYLVVVVIVVVCLLLFYFSFLKVIVVNYGRGHIL